MNSKNKHLINIFIMLLFSILYVMPLFKMNGIIHFTDQDTAFHLSRINGLSNAFNSPVNFNSFRGNGTAMNLFYPWLTLYPAYIFFKITGSLVMAYNIYYFVYTLLTMLFAYICMYSIKKNTVQALTFSILYSFATYRSTDIFFRSSLGEAISLTFLPLILLGCYHIFRLDYKKWYWLTIGMTLTVYTHLLSVLFNAFFIFVALVFALFSMDSKRERVFSLFKATFSTIILSLAVFVPMLEQSSFVQLKVPQPKILYGLQPSVYFSNTLNNSLSFFGIGLILFFLLFYCFNNRNRLSKIELFIFYLGVATLYVSSSLFPWHWFNDTPVSVIQFPWRLTAYATIFLSYSSSISILSPIDTNKKQFFKTAILSILIVLIHSVSAHHLFSQDGKEFYDEDKAISVSKKYFHTDYANQDSLHYPEIIRGKMFLINDSPQDVEYDSSDNLFSFEFNAKHPVEVVTPLYFYKGQTVMVNGRIVPSSLSQYGTTQFELSEGQSSILIYYEYTLLARLAQIVSVFSSIVFTYYLIRIANQKFRSEFGKETHLPQGD